MAYRDDGNSSKATVMKYNDSNRASVGSPDFSSAGIDYPSLALDSN